MFESGVGLKDGSRCGDLRASATHFPLPVDAALLVEVADSARSENRAAARKVLAAGALWDAWIERDAELGSGKIADCGNAAIAELAVRLGCSKTVAESWAALGIDLRLRLPLTRTEFEAGDIDLARARTISRGMTGLSPTTVTALEPQILAAALHLSPGPLATEIERLVALHNPDEAAAQREDAQRFARRIVKRRGTGCATVEVTVSPEEGEALIQLVAEFAGTVCRRDRRGAQERLVDAVMALVHGEPYLECTCGRDDCDAAKEDALPGRRAPLTQITVDLPTLLGLLSEPAYLHGHGLIDPALARQLAANGTWQAMLTEMLELAEELGLVGHDDEGIGAANTDLADPDGADAGDRKPEPEESNSVGECGTNLPESNPAEPPGSGRDDPLLSNPPPPRFCVRSFLARGSRRRAAGVPDTPGSAASPPLHLPPTSVGAMADAILAAVQANPALTQGMHRDGHGGLLVPPAGALTYRPDAATTALVRARDQHCRFPGCSRPAAQCQLDHIVEYLARNPRTGGWTIVSNLQCLCAFHHQLKTLGLWKVVTIGGPDISGHALLWTSTLGSTAVTLPGGASGAADPSGLRPRITGRRGAVAPIATSLDPEPPPF
ncbi:DUF222 domain-containing protein [Rhodococcus spelaei]|uniref:DUF222 domain-containing protein n=1 Tax=Rhodococcus spelaei TaxID=2546320 RepID=A0A541BM43_9NOCA|nr:HNH endonuclease signature motif containing protein [Rhodococcus spelaei]TQF73395.1 DUF222 domain-containing protein [Rhodococcus spelaei]